MRFRIRSLLRIVALSALLFAVPAAIRDRAVRFEGLAAHHRQQQSRILFSEVEIYLVAMEPQIGPCSPEHYRTVRARIDASRRDVQPLVDFLVYQQQLATRYEQAANRPWLPLTPEPHPVKEPSLSYQKALRVKYAEMLDDSSLP